MTAMPFLVNLMGENRDRNRAERLLDELSGIFNWAVAGARRLYRQNDFTECSVCEACVDEHRVASDPFLQFREEELLLGPEHLITSEELYRRYVDFCERNGRRARSSSEIGRQVLALPGVERKRLGGQGRPYAYSGVDCVQSSCSYVVPPRAPESDGHPRPAKCRQSKPKVRVADAGTSLA